MGKIHKPKAGTFPAFYQRYLDKVPDDGDLLKHLKSSFKNLENLVLSLTEEQLLHRYAEGKWSVKEVLVHMMDAERIFAYRALRFARNDSTNLAGFDEDAYVPFSNADKRKIKDIMKEFAYLRTSNIALIKGFDTKMLKRKGSANGVEMPVAALVNLILGHQLHHEQVIRERYL